MKLTLSAALATVLLVSSEIAFEPRALAQTAPQASALADVVRLKDGSLFRGTITELVPKDHVDLLLASGQTRRFSMRDVVYAGAAASAPGATQGSAAAGAAEAATEAAGSPANLHVEANLPDVQLLAPTTQSSMSGSGFSPGGQTVYFGAQRKDYAIACTAPCDVQISQGVHRLALSHAGGPAIEADAPVEVKGPGTLHATYTSRQSTRTAGLVFFLLGVGGGSALVLNGALNGPSSCDPESDFCIHDPDYTQMALGLVLVLGGAVAGIAASMTGDQARVELVPQVTSVIPGIRMARDMGGPHDRSDVRGLGLKWMF